MNVLAAFADDNDRLVFGNYFKTVGGVDARTVDNISKARSLFKHWVPDVVFLDPEEMLNEGPFSGTRVSDQSQSQKSMDKVETAGFIKYLKSVNSNVNLIFASGNSEYMPAALAVRASGFVSKPLTPSSIKKEMSCLRFPVEERVGDDGALACPEIIDAPEEMDSKVDDGAADQELLSDGLSIRAFGSFEAFYKGEPIRFKHAKTKELLAYLIDRCGAMVSNGELVSVLWEDGDAKRHAPYLRAMKLDLQNTLGEFGCGNLILRERGGIACCVSGIDCDYFAYLRSSEAGSADKARARDYRGEYMSQYEWAESTNTRLLNLW